MSVPDLAIGSRVWPGGSKLTEESGELLQVLGKLAAYPSGEHPDGTSLAPRLEIELGDLLGAIDYFLESNSGRVDRGRIMARRRMKLARFRGWHRKERA